MSRMGGAREGCSGSESWSHGLARHRATQACAHAHPGGRRPETTAPTPTGVPGNKLTQDGSVQPDRFFCCRLVPQSLIYLILSPGEKTGYLHVRAEGSGSKNPGEQQPVPRSPGGCAFWPPVRRPDSWEVRPHGGRHPLGGPMSDSAFGGGGPSKSEHRQ